MNLLFKLFLALSVLAQTAVQKSLEFEQTLADHLRQEMAEILPADSFVIVPSAKLKNVRSKVLAQSENFQQTNTEKNIEPRSLPGFDDMKEDSNKSHSRRHDVYEYKEELQVESLAVKVVFEKSLPKELVALAKKTLIAKMSASFGKKAKVSFTTSDLVQAKQRYQYDSQWVGAKAAVLGHWKTLLLISVISIAALFLLLYLFNLARYAGRPKYPEEIREVKAIAQYDGAEEETRAAAEPEEPLLLDGPEQESERAEYEEGIDQLITILTSDPRLSNRFLSMQDKEKVKSLLQVIDNPSLIRPLSDLFPKGTDFSEVGKYEPAEAYKEKSQVISQINSDIVKFKKVFDYSQHQKFGFLTTMDEKAASRFLGDLKDTEIVAVYNVLDRSFGTKLLAQFDHSRKKRLFLALQQPPLPPEELIELEGRLRARYELSESVLNGHSSDENDFLTSMIEAEDDPRELIMAFSENDATISERYKNFLVSFEEFVEKPESEIYSILEETPNETLAMAMSGLEPVKKERLQMAFPEARAKIITSLELSLNGNKTPENIQNAQSEILRKFRTMEKVS